MDASNAEVSEPSARGRQPRIVRDACAILVALCLLVGCGTGNTVNNQKPLVPTVALTATGCGGRPSLAAGTSVDETLVSGGLKRSYRLHLPVGYRNDVEHALVLSFHGHGNSAQMQEHISGMSQLADREDFIAVYPQGMMGPDHRTGWNTGPQSYPHVNDVLFASNLIAHLQTTLCIDPQRIYAEGFSNGGGFTNELACRLASSIAAFAIISGGMHPVVGGCQPTRPVSILEFHGTADQIVPYNGNSANDEEPPIAQWLHDWVKRDSCKLQPTLFSAQKGIQGEEWTGCRDDVVVMHYRITNGGHHWPQGNFASSSTEHPLTASEAIWQFFLAHPLRPGAQGL